MFGFEVECKDSDNLVVIVALFGSSSIHVVVGTLLKEISVTRDLLYIFVEKSAKGMWMWLKCRGCRMLEGVEEREEFKYYFLACPKSNISTSKVRIYGRMGRSIIQLYTLLRKELIIALIC